jgi:hypothetical protein
VNKILVIRWYSYGRGHKLVMTVSALFAPACWICHVRDEDCKVFVVFISPFVFFLVGGNFSVCQKQFQEITLLVR